MSDTPYLRVECCVCGKEFEDDDPKLVWCDDCGDRVCVHCVISGQCKNCLEDELEDEEDDDAE